jgi:hypothetical protein
MRQLNQNSKAESTAIPLEARDSAKEGRFRHARSSDRHGIDTDHARRAKAVGVIERKNIEPVLEGELCRK